MPSLFLIILLAWIYHLTPEDIEPDEFGHYLGRGG